MSDIKVSENLLYEIEMHINNFFNPRNDPNDPQRNYPPAFLELAKKIEEYKNSIEKGNVISEHNSNYSYSVDLDFNSWQKAFAKDLAIWKRVKFI